MKNPGKETSKSSRRLPLTEDGSGALLRATLKLARIGLVGLMALDGRRQEGSKWS